MTARCLDFHKLEVQKQAVRNARALDIEGMVCIGGNGTFKGAEALNALGLPTIGVPATIDNDLAYTDFTIGFDTALNTAVEAVNRIRDTGDAHERASIVTVMGRDCGDLALYTALACGAEAAIIPEVKWSVEKLGDMVHRGVVSGKRSMILVFAEGASRSMVESLEELEAKYPKLHIFGERILSDQLAEIVEEVSGHETRATVLGYTQRGGSPTANDRILATRTGAYAVKLLSQDIGGVKPILRETPCDRLHQKVMPEIRITGVTNEFKGVGRLEGKAVFVPDALPGETVDIAVKQEKPTYIIAENRGVLTASPFGMCPPARITPPAGAAPACTRSTHIRWS